MINLNEWPCPETSDELHTSDFYDGGRCMACGQSGPDPEDEETPAEVIATLRASGWTTEDLDAVPRLRELRDLDPNSDPPLSNPAVKSEELTPEDAAARAAEDA